jgi:hypothetical protein
MSIEFTAIKTRNRISDLIELDTVIFSTPLPRAQISGVIGGLPSEFDKDFG